MAANELDMFLATWDREAQSTARLIPTAHNIPKVFITPSKVLKLA